jgi:uncharacterized protein YndB with AHSA1/START domain
MAGSTVNASTAAATTTREVVITHVFDAPRRIVFEMWAKAEHASRWWGPKGFTIPFFTIDFRPGGAFHYCMRSPEGHDFWGKGIFREIVEEERIVYTDFFVDEDENVVPATYYGMSAEWPEETLVTVTFVEHDGKTTLTVHHVGIPAGTEGDMAEAAWIESLQHLQEILAESN